MPFTVDDVLAGEHVHVESRDDDSGYFMIRVGSLKTRVRIELGRFREGERTKFRVSHAIHTPTQIGPYHPSRASSDYWAAALHDAVTSLTMYYGHAVEAGHDPKEAWLVEN